MLKWCDIQLGFDDSMRQDQHSASRTTQRSSDSEGTQNGLGRHSADWERCGGFTSIATSQIKRERDGIPIVLNFCVDNIARGGDCYWNLNLLAHRILWVSPCSSAQQRDCGEEVEMVHGCNE